MDPESSGLHAVPDADLVSLMCAGNRQAFAALFRRHQRTVYRFAVQMTGSRADAEDITQDVFMALAKTGHHYRPGASALGTYLYGMARHLVLRGERRRRVRAEIDLAGVHGDLPADVPDPVEGLSRAARLLTLRRAILGLPAHYREVVVLCDLNAVSYEEAAAIVGCPIGTIRSRLSRARRSLAERCRAAEQAEPGEPAAAAGFAGFVNGRSRLPEAS